jgi:glucosamine--fructose-6-phosphate aminotransferase (isomerizing)
MPISYERLAGNYLRDILNQPQAMRDTLAALEHIPALDNVRDELRAGRRRRIVLTGMGGSYQVLHPLHLQLTACGFDSILAETSELLYGMPALLAAENVVLAVSQSGASVEIVRLLEHRGPLYIGVSNTPGSPLATRSEIILLTQAGEEGGVSSKTAVTSLAAIGWFGAHLTGATLNETRRELDTLPPAMDAYRASWRGHIAQLVERLNGIKHVFLVGRGASMAAVGLGAMIQKEAAHFHGEGMSSAAFRHGPFEMLGPDSFVVVFEGAENVRELNRGLVRDVLSTGARGALCGPSGEGPFALPPVPDAVRPVLEMLPPQTISLALGYLGGREPGKFERITKVTTVE